MATRPADDLICQFCKFWARNRYFGDQNERKLSHMMYAKILLENSGHFLRFVKPAHPSKRKINRSSATADVRCTIVAQRPDRGRIGMGGWPGKVVRLQAPPPCYCCHLAGWASIPGSVADLTGEGYST